MLVEFRDRGFVKSTIVITHDLSILYQIADTILVMYAGKLVEKASAAAITQDPRHPYTKLLLGSLPEVGVRYAERRLAGIPGRPPVAPRPAHRLPVPGPLPSGVREVRRGATVRRDRAGPVRRLLEGGRLMLELDGVTKVFKTGMFGKCGSDRGLRRELRRATRRGRLPDRRERQRQDDRRPDDPAPDPRDGRRRSRSTVVTCSGLGRRELRDYYAHVQGVFQDPFSSYNPVFKVDRVLGMIRSSYLPEPERGRLEDEAAQVARGRVTRAWPTSSASTHTSSAAGSSSA